MDWTNWKTWAAAAAILIAAFAIYSWAAPEHPAAPAPAAHTTSLEAEMDGGVASTHAAPRAAARPQPVVTPGVEPVRLELLDAVAGSYRSDRNIFAYRERIVPPPRVVTPPPPPDRDKDGIPDFRDNCVKVKNPDQQDIDQDGIGTACEQEVEIAPPPPPPPAPVPPQFPYKFIGMFGRPQTPIATFAREGEIVNARVGDIIDGKFILRRIGIESAEIGFIGFPRDRTQRIPLGQ